MLIYYAQETDGRVVRKKICLRLPRMCSVFCARNPRLRRRSRVSKGAGLWFRLRDARAQGLPVAPGGRVLRAGPLPGRVAECGGGRRRARQQRRGHGHLVVGPAAQHRRRGRWAPSARHAGRRRLVGRLAAARRVGHAALQEHDEQGDASAVRPGAAAPVGCVCSTSGAWVAASRPPQSSETCRDVTTADGEERGWAAALRFQDGPRAEHEERRGHRALGHGQLGRRRRRWLAVVGRLHVVVGRRGVAVAQRRRSRPVGCGREGRRCSITARQRWRHVSVGTGAGNQRQWPGSGQRCARSRGCASLGHCQAAEAQGEAAPGSDQRWGFGSAETSNAPRLFQNYSIPKGLTFGISRWWKSCSTNL